MRSLSNAGSVVVEIVLVVLVLIVGGYAAYETHVAHTSKPAHVSQRATTQAQPRVATTPTAPPPVVYRVPELGFEMTLPPGLGASDLYYVADTTPQTYTTYGGTPYTTNAWADFSTHSLVAQEPHCTPSVSNTGGRGLDAMDVIDIDPTGKVEEPDLLVKLGTNSWLSLDAKQASCSRNDLNATLELQQFHLLEQAFKTAQPL
jgi:hypothetical protein